MYLDLFCLIIYFLQFIWFFRFHIGVKSSNTCLSLNGLFRFKIKSLFIKKLTTLKLLEQPDKPRASHSCSQLVHQELLAAGSLAHRCFWARISGNAQGDPTGDVIDISCHTWLSRAAETAIQATHSPGWLDWMGWMIFIVFPTLIFYTPMLSA